METVDAHTGAGGETPVPRPQFASGCVVCSLALLLVAVAGLSGLAWSMAPPTARRYTGRLEVGMSEQQVVEILGRPKRRAFFDGLTLTYARPLGWSTLYVHFDEDGRFVSYVYDP